MEKKQKKNTVRNVGLASASSDVVKRFGSGIKEHLVSYKGVDNELGKVSKRSLKSISRSKVNPAHKTANIKQQTGFSAEVKEVTRRRVKEAIQGKKPTTIRTDDIPGHVNDQLFDLTSGVDAHGNPIPKSSAQIKFVGASPKTALGKMMGKDYQKYIDNNVKIIVPSDYYPGMKEELQKNIRSLEDEIRHLKNNNGNSLALAAKQKQLEKCKTLNKILKKSTVSNAEALEARCNPGTSVIKDVLSVAHEAGLEQAKTGAAIGGGFSFVKNGIDVLNGKKSVGVAVFEIGQDTASAAAVSYGAAAGGSLIKGAAQNSSSSIVRGLSKTSLPGQMAMAAIEIGKTLKSYFSGKIDGTQFLEELGEKGYSMVGSSVMTVVGQIAIPIPVVGALIGSMVGYMVGAASYKTLLGSLKDAKIAHSERVRIERECEEAISMIRQYRQEMEELIERYFSERLAFFDETFIEIKSAMDIGDVDDYITGMNKITERFGKEPLFQTKAEFDFLMESNKPIII